jgi:hypothetical protein
MKHAALVALAAAAQTGVVVVEGQRLTDLTCNSTICAHGGTCNPAHLLTTEGKTCASADLLELVGATLNDCSAAVAADGNCSDVFSFAESSSDCACVLAGATCAVEASATADAVVYLNEPTNPYCHCSEDTDGEVVTVYEGLRCEDAAVVEGGEEKLEFVRMLNLITDVVNSGELELAATAASVAELGSNLFDHVTVAEAGRLLSRGSDGDIFLDVTVHNVTFAEHPDAWGELLIDSLLTVLAEYGYEPTAGHFRFIGDEPHPERRACKCKPIDEAGVTCDPSPQTDVVETYLEASGDGNTSTVLPVTTVVGVLDTAHCVSYTAILYIGEGRILADWELALIVSACVVGICGVGIGLSFLDLKHHHHRSRGAVTTSEVVPVR